MFAWLQSLRRCGCCCGCRGGGGFGSCVDVCFGAFDSASGDFSGGVFWGDVFWVCYFVGLFVGCGFIYYFSVDSFSFDYSVVSGYYYVSHFFIVVFSLCL